jgi:hypothetical protein
VPEYDPDMRRPAFSTYVVLLASGALSCRTPPSTQDASPPEVASEFRGVAVAPGPSSGQAGAQPVGGGGPSSEATIVDGGAALAMGKARLEQKMDAGTASAEELYLLMGLCSHDEPCLEETRDALRRESEHQLRKSEEDWIRFQKEEGGWTMPDGSIRRNAN